MTISVVQEGIVLDPFDFSPERDELDLHGLGLDVRAEGADWGESQVEAFMVDLGIGSVPAGRSKVPNVDISIPLRVREQEEQPLATAAHQLQQKVQIMREPRGGWLRRDFDEAGGFSGSVACKIFKPSLAGLQGWLFANRRDAPEVEFRASRSPYWYATVEEEGELVSAEDARELIWELSEILGSAPGLISMRVDNKGADPWRGAIATIESADHPQDFTAETTAALAYACEDLTPLGGAAVAEYGADTVVEHTGLTAGWLAVLGSKVAGEGHMTHRGVRRPRFRVYNPGDDADGVQLMLEWRVLGAMRWTPNEVVTVPLSDDYTDIDVGEARPERAVLGDERWEWRLCARATSGAGAVRLHRMRVEPTEQRVKVTAPNFPQAADAQSTNSPDTIANDSKVGTVAWANPENAKASDGSYATAEVDSNALSEYLKATGFDFALPEDAQPVGIVVAIERSSPLIGSLFRDNSVCLVKGGVVQTKPKDKATFNTWANEDLMVNYGAADDLWENKWTAADINSSGFGAAISVKDITGLPHGLKARVDHISITVYYTEAEDENRVCFAERAIEFRSDGVHRQHPTDDVWGRLVPDDGFYLEAPPSLLEARTARIMVVPSVGDFEALADSGSHDIGAQVFYRPAYLFSREALEDAGGGA